MDHGRTAADDEASVDDGTGVSRRMLIKGAGMMGVAAWTVPTVLAMTAAPASASGLASDQAGDSATNLRNSVSTAAVSQGILVATVVLDVANEVIAPPSGAWSSLSYETTLPGDPLPMTIQTFFTFATGGGAITPNFTWTNLAHAALEITSFQGAVSPTPEDTNFSPITTSSTPSAGPVTAGNVPAEARGVLYVVGFRKTGFGNNPGFAGPPGFTNLTNVFQNGNVAVAHLFGPYPVAAGTFPVTTGGLTTARNSAAGLLVIY